MAQLLLTWEPTILAVLGGIIPALVWLWFWLREDREAPEPTGLIAISFFAGMAVVYFALPLQKLVVAILPEIASTINGFAAKFSLAIQDEQTIKIVLWATIEELAKFATVFFIAFKSRYFDEPIDAVIYLITAALGFAAMENILYIIRDMANISIAQIFLDGNLRFIGATLVHTVSSTLIGLAIAFSFYGARTVKTVAVITGIAIASLLHAYFNLSIMESNGTMSTLLIFSQFWIAILGIIALLQVVKRLYPTNNQIQ